MHSPRVRRFAQVDVFGAEPFLGNPLAVILDAEGLSDREMARIARWTNLSETAFLLPPTTDSADYRVRIFTPSRELSFAGHPTLGVAHAWLENRNASRARGIVVQECGIGLVEILTDEAVLSFAAPPTLRDGPLDDAYLVELTDSFGIKRDQIIAHQWVDNGSGWAVVQLSSAEEVLALEPNLSKIPEAKIGVLGAYAESCKYAFEIRAFAPGSGVSEDPVTGSLNAAVAQWLIRTGVAPASFRVAQGTRLGRAGSVLINTDAEGILWVGGVCTTFIWGKIFA